jgi:hypothetical protein
MSKKLISLVVTAALLNVLMAGCYYKKHVPGSEVKKENEKIISVTLQDGQYIEFGEGGAKYDAANEMVNGIDANGTLRHINKADINSATVRKLDAAMSLVATLGVIGAIIGVILIIALATKESCPFVYSFDGENYIFDAEPYGGATCEGLKRTDYCRLEHLNPVRGKYELMFRNEVNETQYTDEVKLLVVDHSPDVQVVPDYLGNFYMSSGPVGPLKASDEKGMDITNLVSARDGAAWQSNLPVKGPFADDSRRHQLTFVFVKPAEAQSARLVVNAGTALWGSEMIRKMLELRGSGVDAWYQGISQHGLLYWQLYSFMEREELYTLKVYLNEARGWTQHGFLVGGGPFITEDRAYPIDISGVQGETLLVQLNPPVGFWSINYIGLDCSQYENPRITELSPVSARDQNGNDILPLISQTDGQYHSLPEIGNSEKYTFDAPAQSPGTQRSIFLKASGYYQLHLTRDRPEQTELIARMVDTPGLIVDYAKSEYLEWRDNQAQAAVRR